MQKLNRKIVCRLGKTILLVLFFSVTSVGNAQEGKFLTPINVSLLEDGRKLQLLADVRYEDSLGYHWLVPEQSVVDGASIPRPFWSVIGGPLVGKYRDASIVHDFYCDTESKSWQEVHRVFYDAMLTRDVSRLKAKLMYAAVYRFGPRWASDPNRPAEEIKNISAIPPYDKTVAADIEKFVNTKNPSLDEIDVYAEKSVNINIRNGSLNIQNDSDCSPVFSKITYLSNVSIVCNLPPDSKKLNAKNNLKVVLKDLQKLYYTNSHFVLPSVRSYAQNPTDIKWYSVRDSVDRSMSFVNLAIDSALDYDSSLIDQVGPTLGELYGILNARVSLLAQVQSGKPADLEQWLLDYRKLVIALEAEIIALQEKL